MKTADGRHLKYNSNGAVTCDGKEGDSEVCWDYSSQLPSSIKHEETDGANANKTQWESPPKDQSWNKNRWESPPKEDQKPNKNQWESSNKSRWESSPKEDQSSNRRDNRTKYENY